MAPTRIAAAAFATVLTAGVLTGCAGSDASDGSGDPVAGGTLNVIRANPFEGFEGDKQTLNSSYQLSQAVLEPLIRVGADGSSLEPGLAASWTYTKGGTRLSIELDPDATFSDGEPVTADDVAFSIETWKEGPNYGASFGSIDEIEVVDDKSLVLHLSVPDTALVAFLAWGNAGVMPADFGGRTAEEFYQDPVGAGPFTVEKWSPNGEVVLEKNEHYYQEGRPYLDEVVSTFASDPNSVTLQLQSGEADMADEILPVTAATLPEDSLYVGPEHLTPVLVMNTREDQLADPDVRRAIAYAIDYDAISEGALKSYGKAPEGALPTNIDHWAPPSVPYFSRDLDQAEELLAGADDAPDQLDLIYPNDASSSVMAQVIQENLGEVGIDVELKSADAATEVGALSSGDYELGLFSNNAITNDAADPAWYIVATATMFTGFPTGEAVDLLTEYAATESDEDKTAAITRLQDLWTEQAPYVALAHTPALEGIRPVVHDAEVTPWGVYYLDTIWKSAS